MSAALVAFILLAPPETVGATADTTAVPDAAPETTPDATPETAPEITPDAAAAEVEASESVSSSSVADASPSAAPSSSDPGAGGAASTPAPADAGEGPAAPEAGPPASPPPATDVVAEKKPPPKAEFTPGAQIFLRGEGRVAPDFGAADAPGIGRVLERVRLQAKAKYGPLTGFAQVQDARVWGFEASSISNEANTDLHQGWLELGGAMDDKDLSGWIRVGRQEVNVGKQRLIGALLWLPGARAFDGISMHGEHKWVSVDMFGAVLQPPGAVTQPAADPADPPETASSHGAQLGHLLVGFRPMKQFNAEALVLAIREGPKEGAILNDRRIGNAGARFWGTPYEGLTYDVEANLQFGAVADRAHQAWAGAANVGYLHALEKVSPGGRLGYSIASGEACTGTPAAGCGATKSTEFFNFFPTNHLYYGFVDLLGWRNMRDLEAGLDLKLNEPGMKFSATYHFFQLQEPNGRWSNVGGANIGAGWDPANTDRNLGHEIDITMGYKPWKPLMIQPGYGVFIPTGAAEAITGGTRPQHFAWLWIVSTF